MVNDRHVAVAFDRDDGERCYVNREYLDELLDRTDDAYQPHTWIQYGKVSGLIEARRDGNALGWVMPVSVKP